jgi:hypothetical protein
MSGGAFDYQQSRIIDIYEEIQYSLDNQGKEIEGCVQITHREDVQEVFKIGIQKLKEAYVYAQRIDWYLSYDDGDDTLIKRLKEDLEKLKQ